MAENFRLLPFLDLKRILSRYYSLGELVEARPIPRGYVNVSYALEFQADGERSRYCFRAYRQGIREEEIRFEHSVICHLTERGFRLTARLVRARDGRTYVFDEREGRFYALFEFLPGEDRYTWDAPSCSDGELCNAATAFARFHQAVAGFVPEGRREEPGVQELLPRIAQSLKRRAGQAGGTAFDRYFLQNLAAICSALEQTAQELDRRGCGRGVRQVIHCDYHPGNLKFEGDEVTGLFDFDWSKIDLRAFDVALALVYFCTEWEGESDGEVRLDKVGTFLKRYQEALGAGTGGNLAPGPLNELELECLPALMAAANLYVLNWAVEDFYGQGTDPQEYLRYLQHSVRLMRWLEDAENQKRLREVVWGRF